MVCNPRKVLKTSFSIKIYSIKMVEKETSLQKIKRLVSDQETIRNVATSAHIHHGKTAFTDNLLAAAGMMAEKNAGNLDEGMATWQHADEQERLMTVDSANVSMAHEYQGKEYLINLIDTPGHVDFGGNVTRAMRAIDGTFVLVCAVEGIMPQTETVLRQALKERVKPVLFINKVDRLIKELKLTPEAMQERFKKVIDAFNHLIWEIAEPEFKNKWQVNVADGSVAFGSAKENWAMSAPFMQKKGVSFKDIYRIYELEGEERKKWVWEKAPLHEVILDIAVKHLPNPLEAQKYRIPKIWHGELESEFGKNLLSCNRDGDVAFVITRIIIDPRSGKEISAGRLYSGTIKNGMEVYCNNAKKVGKIQQVLVYNGIKPEQLESVPAGNVLAISGLNVDVGETVTLKEETPFEEIKHLFQPVITKSIEVVKIADLPKLVEILRKVSKEDPSIKVNINEQTGESLMSGMGELHLEIVENRIKTEKGLEVKTSQPIVVYRETASKESGIEEGRSPNKHNSFFIKVEPLDEDTYNAIESGEIPEGRVKKKSQLLADVLAARNWSGDAIRSVRDIYKGNMFVDETKGEVHMLEVIEMILDAFEMVIDSGPLAHEPCMKVKVSLMDIKLHEDAIHRGPAQVYPAVRESITAAMKSGNAALLEPLQVHVIEIPDKYLSEISKLVGGKRGQIIDVKQEGTNAEVKAKIPVAEMIGWSSDLRSATEGRGTSSLLDQSFERVPVSLQQDIVRKIRDRKGLAENQ
jgi:elongation factor 2